MSDGPAGREAPAPSPATPPCDVCGSSDTAWVRCKLICQRCRTILMSCGDL
jgi:hypothetical protein